MSKTNYDDLLKKKDKTLYKLGSSVYKQTTNKNEPTKLVKALPKQLPISSSPSKNKPSSTYQNVTSRIQSKLPVSVPKKTTPNQKNNKDESINTSNTSNHDKSSLSNTNDTKTQPSLSSTSVSSNTSSDDEELNRLNEMLERFRNNKETSSSYLNKHNLDSMIKSDHESDADNDESSNLNDNENDIENLKNRLNNLRQKLFRNEYEDTNDDLDVDHLVKSSKLDMDYNRERPPIQPKNVKLISNNKQPILLETNKFNSSNRINSNSNINVESIDLKAKQLIEKSESSLSERLVSSDGLGSSRSSSSIMSTLSSNFQETQPYKPEFLRYLENKTKISNLPEINEPIKPEDDILYQWRLRRKLEEAKKLAPLPEPKFDLLPVKLLSTTQPVETKSISLVNITPTKHSMQTQTNDVCDSAVQTSLDSYVVSSLNLKNKTEKTLEKINEIETQTDFIEKPTRDINQIEQTNKLSQQLKTKSAILESKSSEFCKKSNQLSSSPVRSRSRYLLDTNQTDLNSFRTVNNVSADLTRVSSINENNTTNHMPRTSNSPIIFNQSKLTKKSQSNSIVSSNNNLCSTSSSTITVVTASTDFKSNRSSPTNLDQQIAISSLSSKKMNETINKLDNSLVNERKNDYKLEDNDEYDYIEKEMIESDEILRILLKKTYFYRLKLKQIDELLTS